MREGYHFGWVGEMMSPSALGVCFCWRRFGTVSTRDLVSGQSRSVFPHQWCGRKKVVGCAAATSSVSKRTLSVTECLGDAPVSHMLSKRSDISITHNNRGKHNDNKHEDIKRVRKRRNRRNWGSRTSYLQRAHGLRGCAERVDLDGRLDSQ